MNEYIEFEVNNWKRFELLQRIFQKLKADKDKNSFDTVENYLSYFDEQAKSYFWFPTKVEAEDFIQKWNAMSYNEKWSNPNLYKRWSFESMIMSFMDSEIRLLSCEKVSDNTAKINFSAFAHPFGGTGWMEAVIESFGFKILESIE